MRKGSLPAFVRVFRVVRGLYVFPQQLIFKAIPESPHVVSYKIFGPPPSSEAIGLRLASRVESITVWAAK